MECDKIKGTLFYVSVGVRDILERLLTKCKNIFDHLLRSLTTYPEKNKMKRIISLLFAFTFFIIASAQIKDEFWGCKLGTTTKAQLISKLQSYGLKCKEDKVTDVLCIENVTYAGYKWISCSFKFYKNRLHYIGFGTKCGKEEATRIYDTILRNIVRKYPQVSRRMVVDKPSEKNASFDDGNVVLSISYDIDGEDEFATLLYMDKAIAVEINKD